MEPKIEHDGLRLRNYRVMKNITLTKAATLCGVSKSELSKLESGARPVRPDHVIKLAGVYGITPLDLLTPESKLRAFVERASDTGKAGSSDLPLFDGKSLGSQKESARAGGRTPCPVQLADVPGAYAVSISDMTNAPALFPGIVLYVHPGRSVMINDLVINRVPGHRSPSTSGSRMTATSTALPCRRSGWTLRRRTSSDCTRSSASG